MAVELNQEVVNDAAKLMMHRLVARALARDPSLVDRQESFRRAFPSVSGGTISCINGMRFFDCLFRNCVFG